MPTSRRFSRSRPSGPGLSGLPAAETGGRYSPRRSIRPKSGAQLRCGTRRCAQSQPVGSTAGGVLTAAYGPPKDTSGSLSIPRSIGESLGRQYRAPVNGVVRFGSRQGHAAALRDHLTADRVIGAGLILHRKRLLSVGGMGAEPAAPTSRRGGVERSFGHPASHPGSGDIAHTREPEVFVGLTSPGYD